MGDTENISDLIKVTLVVKNRTRTCTRTSDYHCMALDLYHLGKEGPLTTEILQIIKGFQFEIQVGKKDDYIRPLDCKQYSIYSEVICPMV